MSHAGPGPILARLRAARGLSLEAVATHMRDALDGEGVTLTRSALWKWEQPADHAAHRMISAAMLDRYLDALDALASGQPTTADERREAWAALIGCPASEVPTRIGAHDATPVEVP